MDLQRRSGSKTGCQREGKERCLAPGRARRLGHDRRDHVHELSQGGAGDAIGMLEQSDQQAAEDHGVRSAVKPLSRMGCHVAGCTPSPSETRRAPHSWGTPTRTRPPSRGAPPGRRMRPRRRGRPQGRPDRADAKRPIASRFEHDRRAYAGASPWPHFDQKLSLSTAMITRSRASYVSALDPSCPVKSEEPLSLPCL